MSPTGATKAHSSRDLDTTDDFFLPDFCDPRMVLGVVLISELLAVTFALARSTESSFLTELARISLFVQWLGLSSAALLCAARPRFLNFVTQWASAAVFVLLLANTAALSAIAVWFGAWLENQYPGMAFFPEDLGPFLLRNLGIALIVVALLLRYFFISHQWRRHVRAEARSRIHALQARIRPHFLFNSMNTIASLTRSNPERAEEAVEDLADLFRATLSDADRMLRLKEELELTRIYQRIEMLRLGERLQVRWDVAELPMRALVPGLTIQPLLENAIYHGIEPLNEGGLVRIAGSREGQRVVITVTNPVAPRADESQREGNRLALENIGERLRLAYAEEGTLTAEHSGNEFRVTVSFPLME